MKEVIRWYRRSVSNTKEVVESPNQFEEREHKE